MTETSSEQREHQEAVKTLEAEVVNGTLVLVHAPRAASPEDWAEYCRLSRSPQVHGVFVLAPPGCPGPNAKQRRDGAEAIRASENAATVSVLTHSSVHRGIITALNWVTGGSMRAFAPSDYEDALSFAKVPKQGRGEVLARAKHYARSLRVADSFSELWR